MDSFLDDYTPEQRVWEKYQENRLVRSSVEREFIIIGEAVGRWPELRPTFSNPLLGRVASLISATN